MQEQKTHSYNKMALQKFFEVVLKGESKTYNDHNWYVCKGTVKNCLRGYIEGKSTNRYPLLKKPLSEYTIGEIQQFQSNSRDSNGQLWAVGKYQIIPSTFNGLVATLGISKSSKFDKSTQDRMGYQLLMGRQALKNYITSQSPDTLENLQKASLDVAKEWSSVGVPYPVQGKYKFVQKDQSFYSGGGDVASEPSANVMEALKALRQSNERGFEEKKKSTNKNSRNETIFFVALLTIASYILLTQTKQGRKILFS